MDPHKGGHRSCLPHLLVAHDCESGYHPAHRDAAHHHWQAWVGVLVPLHYLLQAPPISSRSRAHRCESQMVRIRASQRRTAYTPSEICSSSTCCRICGRHSLAGSCGYDVGHIDSTNRRGAHNRDGALFKTCVDKASLPAHRSRHHRQGDAGSAHTSACMLAQEALTCQSCGHRTRIR